MTKFSERYGYSPNDSEIVVREDAPEGLRGAVVQIAYDAGLTPHSLRQIVCRVLRVREDPSNWSAFPNVDNEVQDLLDSCEWYEVYDVIEAIHRSLATQMVANARPEIFEYELNMYFRRRGIGWQLSDGEIRVRGNEEFETSIGSAHEELIASARPTAANEIHHALEDLSRRPTPDVTGSIQHALAALECVARDVTGDPNSTLGTLLKRHRGLVPSPLDIALEKLWGYASEQGRHLREGQAPAFEEAELAVMMAASVARYLVRKTSNG